MRKWTITVHDDFFKKNFSGEFEANSKEEAEQEAREFYAEELDTFEDEIKIVKIEEME